MDYNISEDLINSLAEKNFRVKYLFPYQRLVIFNILDIVSGRNEEFPSRQIVILPTGAGKSLCFMLPSLLIKKPTLILFPLLSLMADQKRRLDDAGIETAVLRGGQSSREREEVFSSIKTGKIKVILTNPETLKTEKVMKRFIPSDDNPVIGHMVIDEAHTVSEWGDSFRSAYLETGEIIEKIKPSAVTAFTATASENILKRLKEVLFRGNQVNIISANPDRTNIRYSVVRSISKKHDIIRLAEEAEKPAVIFCSSRVSAELTAYHLIYNSRLREVKFYHAGLEAREKKKIEDWFFHSDNGVLTSTCAYGMGVDKSNIRTVIHYELPGSVESYLQESGRGGRDRKAANAVALYSISDREKAEHLTPLLQKERYLKLLDFAETESECRRNKLLKALSEESAADFCEGCDICDHTYSPAADGKREILYLIRDNNRSLTVNDAVSILTAADNIFKKEEFIMQSASYGRLSGWLTESVKEGINSLIREGFIRKGRLSRRNLLILRRKNIPDIYLS